MTSAATRDAATGAPGRAADDAGVEQSAAAQIAAATVERDRRTGMRQRAASYVPLAVLGNVGAVGGNVRAMSHGEYGGE